VDRVPSAGGEDPEGFAHDGELVLVGLHRQQGLADDEVRAGVGKPGLPGVGGLEPGLRVGLEHFEQLRRPLGVLRVHPGVLPWFDG